MRKILMLPAAAAIVLAGCETTTGLSLRSCATVSLPPACTGSSNKPKVNVNVTGTIQANPPNVCAQPGTTLNFSLAPTPTELNTYAVVPKDPSLFWLIKKNDTDPGTIKVQIPSAKIGEIFEYTIVANDGRCLDPMIEITD